METAKVFANGGSQALRLPKEFQFNGKDVLIRKVGSAVILVPQNKSWEVFMEGLENFSEDFMKNGRSQGKSKKRPKL